MRINILDFGAKADGTLCADKIQVAIDKCFLAGGGCVEITAGEFLTGGLRLRSNVELHLLKNAVLKGSRDPEDYSAYLDDKVEPISEIERNKKADTAFGEANCSSIYPYSRWNNAIIRAIGAVNVAVTGEENYRGATWNKYVVL